MTVIDLAITLQVSEDDKDLESYRHPPGAAPASQNASAGTPKKGPDTCGQIFAPPRTYAPPAFIKDESGHDLIPLTAGEARRLFNLHTRTARPPAFHERWSRWRRRRQAVARKSHYARRIRDHGPLL